MSGLLISICKLVRFNGNALTDPLDRLGVVDGWDVTAGQRSIQGQPLQSRSNSIFDTWRRQSFDLQECTMKKREIIIPYVGVGQSHHNIVASEINHKRNSGRSGP